MSVRILENASVNLRMASKRVEHEIKRCAADERRSLLDIKRAIEASEVEDAVISGQAAIRHHNRRLQMKRTLNSMRVMDEHIRTAIRTRTLHQDLNRVVTALNALSMAMPMERVQELFERFEKHQEDMQINERVFDQTTQHTTSTLVPPNEVAALIAQVATAHSLELSARFSELVPTRAVPTAVATTPQRVAEPMVYGHGGNGATAAAAAAVTTPSAQDSDWAALEERVRRLAQ